jgi:NAD(P)-dependent dehydrogenase (short-subunit alcohol dehydrogenase family)
MQIEGRWEETRLQDVLQSPVVRWGAGLAAAYGLYKLVQKLREEDLTGQVVFITGGSRGLGLLMAREFGACGCRVAICARDGDELRRAALDLQRQGIETFAVSCDVTDRKQIRQMVEEITEHFGRIDILVNNAGIIRVGPMQTMRREDYQHALDVMFWPLLHTAQAVLPQMRRRGAGKIVNITSIGGMVSVPHLLPYNCAKFAAVGLSQGLHAELRREGIIVTTIVPGTMRLGSHLNASFRGNAAREYEWFALGATLPGVSVKGERAARQIVRATRRGEALRIIGLPANILERLHGLMPGTMAHVLTAVNSFLPKVVANGSEKRGIEAARELNSRFFDTLTSGGFWAADRTNQFDNDSAEEC